jgi:hypothetical protein
MLVWPPDHTVAAASGWKSGPRCHVGVDHPGRPLWALITRVAAKTISPTPRLTLWERPRIRNTQLWANRMIKPDKVENSALPIKERKAHSTAW